ncbi:sigma-70 family RNA polymerase sigma factor [Chitinophaga oryzae]|uniref:Sigma-70 family RNA polymerase sigma factor n=1 Tax=Chitinophaga oryzae TaxID=2725414 RepID=A0AAE7D9M8_9BACT|nr:sigma-70 family RNA polymerase sigma factor [Chitinophaga oryzae]QJB34427.1 sigma-70 family RNA polymerase sigma factor [Chitinophaga oryzae]QJB40944.1 sigma-70 family RNA polymerase sigma factor [Chitinophaga oryzae]
MTMHNDPIFESVYRDTLPKVARMVHRMGGDLDTAKDIFHDAVIIYLEKKQQNTSSIASDQAYIMGIARILCLRRLKDDHQYVALPSSEDDYGIPADFYDPPPVAQPVINFLKSAGRKCLQLLQAFYYDKLPMAEIAQTLQYKTQHVATVQKYKCLEKIREQVKQTQHEEAAL